MPQGEVTGIGRRIIKKVEEWQKGMGKEARKEREECQGGRGEVPRRKGRGVREEGDERRKWKQDKNILIQRETITHFNNQCMNMNSITLLFVLVMTILQILTVYLLVYTWTSIVV